MTTPPVPSSAEIQLLDLEKRFREVRAVDGVSLEVGAGEFFSLLGPSGCGKTTTLRMIGGFELPTGGRILLRGRDVTNDPPDKRPVNMVFQNYALFPHLDVGDNVAFGLRRRKVAKPEIARRVGEALELVHLNGYERRRPNQLSGGQQQRVALARALVNRPNVLLLDEPLGALDLKLRRQLQVELKRIQNEVGITFVYVTHDQEEALTMSDRIAVMHAGKVEQLGTPEELYERPTSRFVADFIGSTNLLRGRIEPDGWVRLSSGDTARVAHDGLATGTEVEISVRPEAISPGPARGAGCHPGHRRTGRLSRNHDLVSASHGRRTGPHRAGTQSRDPTPGRQRCRRHLVTVRGTHPRRRPGTAGGGSDMTQRPDEQDVDIEQALVRYMVERRITRRMLLEQIGKVGAFAALAPIIAACTSAAASAAPSQAAAATASAPPTTAPTAAATAAPTATPEPTPVPTPEKQLNIYNWDAYIGETTRQDFEKKYGIKVNYDKFPDASTQITKIRSDGKGGGYDLTYPASTDVAPLARDGVIAALDLSLIPNIKNLGPAGRTPPTTRATSTRSRTTGGRPGSPGTRTRSRRTSPAGRHSGTRRTRARWGCCPTSRRCSPPGHSGWG